MTNFGNQNPLIDELLVKGQVAPFEALIDGRSSVRAGLDDEAFIGWKSVGYQILRILLEGEFHLAERKLRSAARCRFGEVIKSRGLGYEGEVLQKLLNGIQTQTTAYALAERRYFWSRELGLSGMVRSMRP